MWASSVVKSQISANADAGLRHGLVGVEVDLLIFDRSPEPLDEDVVAPGALAIHRDGDFGFLQHCRDVHRGELRSLVRVEDIGLAITGKCRFDDFGHMLKYVAGPVEIRPKRKH